MKAPLYCCDNKQHADCKGTIRPKVFNAIDSVYTTNLSYRVTKPISPYSNEEKGNDFLAELQNSSILLIIAAHSPFHLFLIFATSVLKLFRTPLLISHVAEPVIRSWQRYGKGIPEEQIPLSRNSAKRSPH
jgi:hypothetical protein